MMQLILTGLGAVITYSFINPELFGMAYETASNERLWLLIAVLLATGGRYRQLYDKQYRFERDRFINPGEDFTPEPEAVVARSFVRANNAL